MTRRISEHALTAADQELLSRFISEARREIHADFEKAPSQFKPFFLYLEREIFRPDFSITAARSAANLKSNNYSTKFYQVTGRRPREYVEHCRVMLAQRIIRYSDIYCWQVGAMVGFADPSVFSRNYRKVVGYPPNKEKKSDSGKVLERSGSQRPSTPSATSGTLDPRVSPNTAEIVAASPRLDLDKFWQDTKGMTRPEIKNYVLAHASTIDVDHYYYLLERAKREARVDKRRGRELCQAALDTLRLAEFMKDEEFPDEKALGYANLANICRMEFDFPGARKWFRVADRLLRGAPDDKILLFTHVNFLRAALLWWQRDTEAALRLLDDILPDIRQHGSNALLARALLLKAEICDCTGNPVRALPPLSEAVKLTKIIDDQYVVFSAHFNLTLVYTRLSMATEAVAQFKEVNKLIESIEGQVSRFYVLYLEGSVSRVNEDLRTAELLFLQAREGFLNHGLDIYAALVALELAMVYLELRDPDKAFLTARGAIPSISRHSFHQEAIAALAVLQDAERLQRVDKSILKQVLHHLDLVRQDPTANFLR